MGNETVTINADGTVNHTKGYTARWQPLGGNQHRLTWNNGAIDTLTLSPDGRAMDGTNNYGNTVHVTCAGGSTPVPGTAPMCTPVGTWNWVGNETVTINADGTVNHTKGYTARWQPLGGNQYRLTWNNGAVDTLTLSPDGRAMDGTNNYGNTVHVTCAGGSTPAPGTAPMCTPAGTWRWVGNEIVTINADGTVNHTKGYTARWQPLGGNRYRLTWNNGAIDTLTLSPDGLVMDGTNNYGNTVHVTCGASDGGSPTSPGGTGGGGICSDPRTQAVMDEWLSRANPPDNTRPGWNVRYDSWGRMVGRTRPPQSPASRKASIRGSRAANTCGRSPRP